MLSKSSTVYHTRWYVCFLVSAEDGEQKGSVAFFIPDDDHVDDHIMGQEHDIGEPPCFEVGPVHALFCELEELHECKDGELEWKETARYVFI